ncbi:hypothetical protein LWI29_033101 [Acer saccharum]|uniref:F-box protein GID2 n=1 Tax=Acer saccharum TaxID=4024 RepID=A0AA39VEW5_ACESA|nr:hypothetical protein LWI29_033101 [Acer saccharum]
MKRTIVGPPATGDDDHKMKRIKHDDDVVKREEEEEEKEVKETGFTNLHESLLFEVLKHVDDKTLATVGCVSKQWHKTAQDERLWELICTRHWPNFGCDYKQLRSVVLALGGFRRLHSQLSRHPSGSGSNWASLPMIGSKSSARWGRDEVHLSLSLLSIRFYEAMNSGKRSEAMNSGKLSEAVNSSKAINSVKRSEAMNSSKRC